MFRFRRSYFLLALLLLGVEIFIAARVHDQIIRPYVGDYLVVIWLYCLVRSFLNAGVLAAAAGVLAFSYLVEVSQYFRLADRLGCKGVARIVLGSYFTWTDIVAYTLGIGTVILSDRKRMGYE